MNFLVFSDGLKAPMILGRDSLMLMDPKSPEQQMIRSKGIDDMESSSCCIDRQSRDATKCEGRVASEI